LSDFEKIFGEIKIPMVTAVPAIADGQKQAENVSTQAQGYM
jgi:hypothetical protein